MNIPGLLDIIAYPHTALPSTGCRPWGRMAHWELWLDATVQALKGGCPYPLWGLVGKTLNSQYVFLVTVCCFNTTVRLKVASQIIMICNLVN